MTNYSDMTNEQLDKAVAKMMGWKRATDGDWNTYWVDKDNKFQKDIYDWYPSIDILHALEVMNQMIADGYDVFISHDQLAQNDWEVYFNDYYLVDHALPRAICIASLIAKESEEKDE